MSENSVRKITDEEIEKVTGGKFGGHPHLGTRERERQEKVEQLAKEAVGRMDPNDPTSWFQTVSDVFDENAGNQ